MTAPASSSPRPDGALVLFSGGQDSSVCLAWALDRYARVETAGFTYGQTHAVEMEARLAVRREMAAAFPEWAARLGEDHVLDLSSFGGIGQSALTGGTSERADGLPATFVPGRNLAFLIYAAALAERRQLRALAGGMCETDFSGYPDCRRDTLDAMQTALNLGMAADFVIETPLMALTKAQTWELADDLGGAALTSLIEEHSHTCYAGDREHRHPWGYGCGACDACGLRAKGWAEWRAEGRFGA
ncbi:MAG: 7-cyano-7-deazaguanine synthase QueC [Caulobacteraceae bacterium]